MNIFLKKKVNYKVFNRKC